MEYGDAELVKQAQEGDKEAFRVLVQRYQRRILSVVIGVLRDSEDAQEVVQETFIRAYRNLPGFKGDSSLYTWLYRIAVNLSIDFQRREKKRTMVPFDEGLPHSDLEPAGISPSGGEDPFALVRNRELVGKVFDAIEELTPNHRAVILLREVEGLSYEEISEVLGCSMGTVMSRLHYARKKFHESLAGLG